jgi:hypothetical protein
MAFRKKDGNRADDSDKDDLDALGPQDEHAEDAEQWHSGYRRRPRTVFIVQPDYTEEELAERMRVLASPITLEEKIQAHVLCNLIEIDGKIGEEFAPLVEGLEKCGITLAELFQLMPELAPQQHDNKGRPI